MQKKITLTCMALLCGLLGFTAGVFLAKFRTTPDDGISPSGARTGEAPLRLSIMRYENKDGGEYCSFYIDASNKMILHGLRFSERESFNSRSWTLYQQGNVSMHTAESTHSDDFSKK